MAETCRNLVARCEASLGETLQGQLLAAMQQQKEALYSSLRADFHREISGSCTPRGRRKFADGSRANFQQHPPPHGPGPHRAMGALPWSGGSEAYVKDVPLSTQALSPFATGDRLPSHRGSFDDRDSLGNTTINIDAVTSAPPELESTLATPHPELASPRAGLARETQRASVAIAAMSEQTPRTEGMDTRRSVGSCGSPRTQPMTSAVLVPSLSPQPNKSSLVHLPPAPQATAPRSPSARVVRPCSSRGQEFTETRPQNVQRRHSQGLAIQGGPGTSGGEVIQAALAVATSACDGAAARRWRLC